MVVDEAGMLATPACTSSVTLAERNDWRLALVGDPRQLQAVGRGGLFAELCANGRSRSSSNTSTASPTVGSSRVAATATR